MVLFLIFVGVVVTLAVVSAVRSGSGSRRHRIHGGSGYFYSPHSSGNHSGDGSSWSGGDGGASCGGGGGDGGGGGGGS